MIAAVNLGADDALLEGLKEVVASHASALKPLVVHHFRGRDADSLEQEMSNLVRQRPDCVVVCLPPSGVAVASAFFAARRCQRHAVPVLVLPSEGELLDLNELWSLGAFDLLVPPVRAADWGARLLRTRGREPSGPNAALRLEVCLDQIVGNSAAWLREFQKLPCLARSDATVLIRGETGTGKELCARGIHYLSRRSNRPFVPINCGAVPTDLIENELFGHERGAFTGAVAAASGLIREAEGGTVFFDEVDALPAGAQVKLLRFLQDKT
jgi:DNA-binding NtrC family response regulator